MRFMDFSFIKNNLRNKDIKVLIQNIISLLSLRGLNFIIPALTLPYLLNVLDPYYFGIISFAESTVFYFIALTEYSFNITGTREVSRRRENKAFLNEIYSIVFYIKLLVSVTGFALLIAYFLLFDSDNNYLLIFAVTYCSVFGYFLLPTWFFQGIEKMKFIAILNLFAKACFAILLFLFVKDEQDYVLVPFFNSSGMLLAGVAGHLIACKLFKIKISFPGFQPIISKLKSDFNVFISTVAPTLYNNSSIFLLGLFSTPVIVGYFTAANKFVEIALSLIRILSSAFFPFLNRNLKYHSKATLIFFFSGGFLSLMLFFGAEFLLVTFGSSLYTESIKALKLLSPCPLLIAITQCYSTNYLLILKKDKLVRNITVVCSLIGLAIAVVTIPIYDMLGVIFTLVFTRALLGTIYIIFVNKINKNKCNLVY